MKDFLNPKLISYKLTKKMHAGYQLFPWLYRYWKALYLYWLYQSWAKNYVGVPLIGCAGVGWYTRYTFFAQNFLSVPSVLYRYWAKNRAHVWVKKVLTNLSLKLRYECTVCSFWLSFVDKHQIWWPENGCKKQGLIVQISGLNWKKK